MPGIEPGPLKLSPETVRPPVLEDNRSTAAHRKYINVQRTVPPAIRLLNDSASQSHLRVACGFKRSSRGFHAK